MITKQIRDQYTTTVGIECHVQLKTKTKLFAAVENDARDAAPNTLISHICLGMPGALPVLNSKAVHLASKAAFALHTTPQPFSKFDRKHYFYPDLPKGYQISQFDEPIILGGYVEIIVDGQPKKIGITRAHLEEDAGKSTHPAGRDYSLVDLNRAGTPLLEIVSEPEIHSSAEAKAYAKELYLLMRYADVSDANLYYGNMRFDVNISVSKTDELGIRSEIKNLNSFRSVEKSVEYEVDRQIALLEKGDQVVQETRGWDDAKQQTFSQRTKEDAHDYRYFPDPDIPPIILDDAYIRVIEQEMSAMPDVLRSGLAQLGMDTSATETIVGEPEAGRFMLEVMQSASRENAVRIGAWLAGEVQAMVAGDLVSWESAKLSLQSFVELAEMVDGDQLSSTAAKTVMHEMVVNGGSPEIIAKSKNLLQLSDASELEVIVRQVLEENPQAAKDVAGGEVKAIGFLVGQVMKASQGKANPGIAQELIKSQLGL